MNMSNINLTPDQVQKLGNHLQKEAENDFEIRPIVPQTTVSEALKRVIPDEPMGTGKQSLKDRIKDLEAEYKGSTVSAPKDSLKKSYLDEMGRDTFYVKNISGNHVAISELEFTIKKGAVENLLEVASLEDCYSSRDLKKLMNGYAGDSPALKRITEEEYADEMEKAIISKKKIEVVRQQESIKQYQNQNGQNQNNQNQNNPFQNPTPRVDKAAKLSYKVIGQLEKLRLSTAVDPEDSKFGINSAQFIQWMWQEVLSDEELDYILGDPMATKFPDVKYAAIEKKTIK
jgi:hypothetical protein